MINLAYRNRTKYGHLVPKWEAQFWCQVTIPIPKKGNAKGRKPWVPSTCAGDLRGLLMVALRSQGNWRWEGPLGTPLGLAHWKRASSPVEAGTAGYL